MTKTDYHLWNLILDIGKPKRQKEIKAIGHQDYDYVGHGKIDMAATKLSKDEVTERDLPLVRQ